MVAKSQRIEAGTKVLIYTKTRGCSIEKVLRRLNKYSDTITSVPITAWVVRDRPYDRAGEYTLTYKAGSNRDGDFYRREDFKLYNEEMFEDRDFLL